MFFSSISTLYEVIFFSISERKKVCTYVVDIVVHNKIQGHESGFLSDVRKNRRDIKFLINILRLCSIHQIPNVIINEFLFCSRCVAPSSCISLERGW